MQYVLDLYAQLKGGAKGSLSPPNFKLTLSKVQTFTFDTLHKVLV